MRDYFLYPAQTNLELYAQAIDRGYDAAALGRLGEAHHYALRQVHPLARGSGKPFIAHLVGTASLVLASDAPPDWVLGALLHALYQRRVPFEAGLPPDARRPLLVARFGATVDDLIQRYTTEEDDIASRWLTECPDTDRDVLTLRLADELEDLGGFALALHGSAASDEVSERGGYLWRQQAMLRRAPGLFAAAGRLGLEGMARGFRHWLDFSAYPAGLKAARTGWVSSVSLQAEANDH